MGVFGSTNARRIVGIAGGNLMKAYVMYQGQADSYRFICSVNPDLSDDKIIEKISSHISNNPRYPDFMSCIKSIKRLDEEVVIVLSK